MTFLISILLFLPTASEVYNDRKGDLNKRFDIIPRTLIMAAIAMSAHFGGVAPFLVAFNLSLALFFFFFDYMIAFVLINNGKLEPPRGVKYHWFTYTAKKGWFDNLKWWKFSPWLRFGIKLAYLIVALILFLSKSQPEAI